MSTLRTPHLMDSTVGMDVGMDKTSRAIGARDAQTHFPAPIKNGGRKVGDETNGTVPCT